MIKKLSAVTAAYISITFVLSTVFSDSFMPMLFSFGLIAGVIKLCLVSCLLYLMSRTKFKYKLTVQLLGLSGVALFFIGVVGMLSVNLEYASYPYLMTMDYVAITEISVIICLAGLTYGYKSDKYQLKLPSLAGILASKQSIFKSGPALPRPLLDRAPLNQATSLSRRRTRLAN